MNITCDVPFRHKAEIAILSSVHDSIDGGDNIKFVILNSQEKSFDILYLSKDNSLDSTLTQS